MYAPKPTEDRPSDRDTNPMLSEQIAIMNRAQVNLGVNHFIKPGVSWMPTSMKSLKVLASVSNKYTRPWPSSTSEFSIRA